MELYSPSRGFANQGHRLSDSTPFLHAEGDIYEDEHVRHDGSHYVNEWVDGGDSPARLNHLAGNYENDENSRDISMDDSNFHDAIAYEESDYMEAEDAQGFHQY